MNEKPTVEEVHNAIKELSQRDDAASKIAVFTAKSWLERQYALEKPIFLARALQKMNEAMDESAAASDDLILDENNPDSLEAGLAVRNAAEAWLMLEWREGYPESHAAVALAFPKQKEEHVAFMPLSLLPPLQDSKDEQVVSDSFVDSMLDNVKLEAALMQLPQLPLAGLVSKYELYDENIERLRIVLRAARKWGDYQCKILGLDPLKDESAQENVPEELRDQPLEIRGYAHCVQCIKEKPKDQSPAEWARFAVGSTMAGIQVWCMRHNCNIVHVQYKPYIASLEQALHGEAHEHNPECEHGPGCEHADQPEPPPDELLAAITELEVTVELMKNEVANGIKDPMNIYLQIIALYEELRPIFWAIPQFAKVMAKKGELGCMDCGRKYSIGPDLMVSDEDWSRIAPKVEGGGVLCPNCMHDRFVQVLGDSHKAGNIRAIFASGPFAPDKPTPIGVLWERIRLLRLAIMEEHPLKDSNLSLALDKDLALWRETEQQSQDAHA